MEGSREEQERDAYGAELSKRQFFPCYFCKVALAGVFFYCTFILSLQRSPHVIQGVTSPLVNLTTAIPIKDLGASGCSKPFSGVRLCHGQTHFPGQPNIEDLTAVCKQLPNADVCDIEDVAAAAVLKYSTLKRGWTRTRQRILNKNCNKRMFNKCHDTLLEKGPFLTALPTINLNETNSSPLLSMNVISGNKVNGTNHIFCCEPSPLPQPALRCDPSRGDWTVKIAYALLGEYLKIAKKHNVSVWVMSGSLIGVIRDRSLVNKCIEKPSEGGQPDIDFGINSEDLEKLAKGSSFQREVVATLGARLIRGNRDPFWNIAGVGKHVDFSGMFPGEYGAHVAFEFWPFKKSKAMRVHHQVSICGKYFEEPMQEIEISAGYSRLRMKVPHFAEEILEERYGDWWNPNGKNKFHHKGKSVMSCEDMGKRPSRRPDT